MVSSHDCEFVPTSPIPKKYEFCTVKDCGKETNGRQYCEKHQSVDARRKVSQKQRAFIRSDCCDAKCISGKVHENGEQYCTKCKLPCCWRTERGNPRGGREDE